MNGGQNRNNEFLLDGAPNNANQGGNNIAYVPPAEAVQEFKVSTNSYDAQYGRTAARRQHVAQVRHQQLSRRRLLLHAAQGTGGHSFLLNSRNQPGPTSTSTSTASASTADLEEQDVSSCSPPKNIGKARQLR